MIALLLIEILAMPAEQSRGRHNSRVVKRKMSNFPTKARAAPSPGRPGLHYAQHIQIVAPAQRQRSCPVRDTEGGRWGQLKGGRSPTVG